MKNAGMASAHAGNGKLESALIDDALKGVRIGRMDQKVDILTPAQCLIQSYIALPMAVTDALALQFSE
ncbi:hypothetical protein [Sphingobium sp. TKS]|uniref:hypothetical protein n=1 Tax=Sphingobium sp. TKS TaxID=1315974 RepID=UPI0011A15AF0|nr:hypothetical protein [Sphingobium sp. TKS]